MQISSKNPLVYIGFWCVIALIMTNLLPEPENEILEIFEDESPKVSLLQKDNIEMMPLRKKENDKNADIF